MVLGGGTFGQYLGHEGGLKVINTFIKEAPQSASTHSTTQGES